MKKIIPTTCRPDKTRKRAAKYGTYYTIMKESEGSWIIQKVRELCDTFDDLRYAEGNYYLHMRSAKSRIANLRLEYKREMARKLSRQIKKRK